jgi:type I restriction enzyme M protein
MKLLTKPLESATRKRIDEYLKNLGWETDEFKKDCNVYTERPRTKAEKKKIRNKYPLGKFPDYILYSSSDFKPIAIIEAKRPGENLQKAINQAMDYARCLNIDIIFAIDGAIIESRYVSTLLSLKIDGSIVTELVNERTLLKFISQKGDIITPQNIIHTKQELIDIFSYANELLRQEGMREGVERFTEFSNLLFLKLIDEIEDNRELNGEKRRLDKKYCWSSFYEKKEDELLDYINDTVLPKLVDKYNHSGEVFENKLKIKSASILKSIVNKLSKLTLLSTDSDIKGDAFEYFLKNSITVGNDLGEYFTPRHIVKLIVDFIEPQFGDRVYDPCCGTGGFLIEAFRQINTKVRLTKENIDILENKTIYGRELTGTSKIAKMNMILAGDGHTNIVEMDALSDPVKNKYDIILTNYPFAQTTNYGSLYGLNTTEGNPVFLKHIIDALKVGGKAGVVVPDGVLFGKGNDYIKVRKILVETCDVKAVIQLDTAVFRPYTAQPTSILIFEKGKQTEKVWFFEIVNDGFKKTTSKKGRPPIKNNDIPLLRTLWSDKQITHKSFFVEYDKIKDSSYKLFMNYYKPRKLIRNPKELGKLCEDLIIGGTPNKKNREYYGGSHLWANISDMREKFITKTELKLSDLGKEKIKNKQILKGTLLMSFKLTLGKTAIAGENLFTNEAICGLIFKDKEDETLIEYLYYILPLINYLPYAQRASKGLTLNKELIPTVEIPFPEKSQRKLIIEKLRNLTYELQSKKEQFKKEISEKENEINQYMQSIV